MTANPTDIDLGLCHASPRARGVDPRVVDALAESIAETGLLQPITVRRLAGGFEVIAGMHRVGAFRKLARATIPAIIREMDDLRAELALIDENLVRNDLSAAERSAAQARRKALWQELHPETRNGAAGKYRSKSQLQSQLAQVEQAGERPAARYDEAAAQSIGQSPATIRRDVHRGEALGAEVLARVARTSLDKGEELDALTKLSPERRDRLVEKAAAGEKVSACHEVKKERRDSREKVLAAVQLAMPDRRYGVILADPEWRFEVYSRDTGMDRAADNHYPTSPTEEIMRRPVGTIAADDCALFLWATAPMIREALAVMAAWGFDYKSMTVWRKDRLGTGYWFRNMHELLLVGTRGNIPAPAMGAQFSSVFDAPVGRHSEKPDWQYELIESYFPHLPKIELNARRARPGWDAWGLEAPMAAGAADDESQAKADGAEGQSENVPQGVEPAASRAVDGRSSTATSEPMDATAGETAPVSDDALEIPAFLRRAPAEARA
ncbi:MAG: hypothetical protein EPO23_03365 [Xanthobacteraceae bacterium]|nr:MAG: hypothetical protein EPO23_03365 [Xanthobacteraceae bacterium]